MIGSKKILIFFLILGIGTFFLPYERMDFISVLVLVIGAILVVISLLLTDDFGSPQVVLVFTWTIALFLASLDVVYAPHLAHFNQDLNLDTWLVIGMSILTFYLASVLAMYPLRRKCNPERGNTKIHFQAKHLKFMAYAGFIVAAAVYLFAVIRSGGLPAFSDNVNDDRQSFIPGTLGVFFSYFQFVVVITCVQILITGFRKNYLLICIALASLTLSLLTTQRIAAIESVLMSGLFLLIFWRYLSVEQVRRVTKPLLISGTCFIAVFVYIFILIGDTRGLNLLQLTDLENLAVEQLFVYFGGPSTRNFQMILDGGIHDCSNSVQSGALFFRPILWFIGFRDEVTLNDTFRGPNNATALFQYYEDLGYLGLFLFPLIWGLVTGFLYGRFRRNPSLFNGFAYVIFGASTYFFPLSERFSEPATLVKLGLFLGLVWVGIHITKFLMITNLRVKK